MTTIRKQVSKKSIYHNKTFDMFIQESVFLSYVFPASDNMINNVNFVGISSWGDHSHDWKIPDRGR